MTAAPEQQAWLTGHHRATDDVRRTEAALMPIWPVNPAGTVMLPTDRRQLAAWLTGYATTMLQLAANLRDTATRPEETP